MASGGATTPTDVGPAVEFPDGSVRRVQAGNRTLVVVNHAGQLHALRDQCPHQGAALSQGRVLELACARMQDGQPLFTGTEVVLQCPWHGWAFRLDDGNALGAPGARVRRYAARIDAGRVLVEL